MKDKTKPGCIYKVVLDIPTPHIVYVGATTQPLGERLSHHAAKMRRPTKLNKLINQLGKDHFTIEMIEEVADYDERYRREQYWTEQLMNEPDNCNECVGTRHSEEMCLRDSINSYRNREVVCENDGKIYRSCMEASKAYDLKCSDVSECCARHLRQSKGYYFRYTDEDRDSYIAYWESDGIIRNRPIKCIETGKVYRNSVEASKDIGVGPTAITRCCEKQGILRKSKLHLVFIKPYAHLPKAALIDSASL